MNNLEQKIRFVSEKMIKDGVKPTVALVSVTIAKAPHNAKIGVIQLSTGPLHIYCSICIQYGMICVGNDELLDMNNAHLN